MCIESVPRVFVFLNWEGILFKIERRGKYKVCKSILIGVTENARL